MKRESAHRLSATMVLLLAFATAGRAQSTDQVTYYHTDAIGSVRMITDATGQVVQRHDYLPFGEEWTQPAQRDQRMFAGKERDPETGFDYFGGRYYASGTGRFTSVDPGQSTAANLADPQLWNRYVYVRNNPLRYTDPDGRCIWDLCVGEGVATWETVVAATVVTTYLVSPDGQRAVRGALEGLGQLVTTATAGVTSLFLAEDRGPAGLLPERAGPVGHISPGEVVGKTPQEIDRRARELGLVPKGPSPEAGRGSYVDPATGEQRILSHPNDPHGPHAHVNDPNGERIGPDGRAVPRASGQAHLPIRKSPEDDEIKNP